MSRLFHVGVGEDRDGLLDDPRDKPAKRRFVCLEALTMFSKLVHVLIAGKFDQEPEYIVLAGRNSFVRFFGARLVPSTAHIEYGAARATRGL